jgi:hypothetical protein
VIPVLVGDTRMPRPEELPEAIRPLARRNAVRLTHDRFRADVQGLIKALQRALEEVNAAADRRAALEQEQAAAKEARERSRRETEAWAAASSAGDVAALKAFVKEWPHSQHADAARAKIKEFKGATKRTTTLSALFASRVKITVFVAVLILTAAAIFAVFLVNRSIKHPPATTVSSTTPEGCLLIHSVRSSSSRTATIIYSDYAVDFNKAQLIEQRSARDGFRVVYRIKVSPVMTDDYLPYIQRAQDSGADLVFACVYSPAVFLRQVDERGGL